MQNLVITNAGQELMTSLITKGTTASFTKIATSEHAYEKEELGNLLALEDIKQEVAISKLEQKDASTIEITAAITNEELTEGYYINALGLYIKDNEGNEMLYAVAIDDTPDYVPAFDNKTISSIIYRLNVRVSNSEQVTLEIDPKVYATAKQVEELSDTVSEADKSLQEQIDKITAGGTPGASSVKEIALTDYLKLTEEEQNNGTLYCIPDAIMTNSGGVLFAVENGILTAIYDDGTAEEGSVE